MAPKAERQIDIRPYKPESIWPTPPQLQLLRAALWPGAEGREAWQAWKDTTELGTIDFGSWNLLPLVWRNLGNQGLADPVLDECRSYYRFHWARNQMVLKQAAGRMAPEVLGSLRTVPEALLQAGFAFADADIEAVLLAGLAARRTLEG